MPLIQKIMPKVSDRTRQEIRDALNFGQVGVLVQLAPQISSLNKHDQWSVIAEVVRCRRVDFVRAMESVDWKRRNWKEDVLYEAASTGCIDIVHDMAPDVEPKAVAQGLVAAAFCPTQEKQEIVRYLAPLVHAAGLTMCRAIHNAVLSMSHPQTEDSKRILNEVLLELFFFERVEAAVKHMLQTENNEWCRRHFELMTGFIQTCFEDASFIENQSAKPAPRPGKWRASLDQCSPEGSAVIGELEARCAARLLAQGLPKEANTLPGKRSPRL